MKRAFILEKKENLKFNELKKWEKGRPKLAEKENNED